MESIVKNESIVLIKSEKKNKKRKTVEQCVLPISNTYNLDYHTCRKLCREIKITKGKTIEQATRLVKRNLKLGMDINEIIIKYNLEYDCIF